MSSGARVSWAWGTPPLGWEGPPCRALGQPGGSACALTLHARVLAHQEGGPLQRGRGGLRASHDHVQDTGHHIVLSEQAIRVCSLQRRAGQDSAGGWGPRPHCALDSRRPPSHLPRQARGNPIPQVKGLGLREDPQPGGGRLWGRTSWSPPGVGSWPLQPLGCCGRGVSGPHLALPDQGVHVAVRGASPGRGRPPRLQECPQDGSHLGDLPQDGPVQLQEGPQPGADVEQLGSETPGGGEGGSSLLRVCACPADVRDGYLPWPQEGARAGPHSPTWRDPRPRTGREPPAEGRREASPDR